MQPNNDQLTKLTSLRVAIQHAVAQFERGEVIRDFKMAAFLGERHRERLASLVPHFATLTRVKGGC
jgi:hypothetical protein